MLDLVFRRPRRPRFRNMGFEGYGVAARTGHRHLDEPADLLGQRACFLVYLLAKGLVSLIDRGKVLLERRDYFVQVFHRVPPCKGVASQPRIRHTVADVNPTTALCSSRGFLHRMLAKGSECIDYRSNWYYIT